MRVILISLLIVFFSSKAFAGICLLGKGFNGYCNLETLKCSCLSDYKAIKCEKPTDSLLIDSSNRYSLILDLEAEKSFYVDIKSAEFSVRNYGDLIVQTRKILLPEGKYIDRQTLKMHHFSGSELTSCKVVDPYEDILLPKMMELNEALSKNKL